MGGVPHPRFRRGSAPDRRAADAGTGAVSRFLRLAQAASPFFAAGFCGAWLLASGQHQWPGGRIILTVHLLGCNAAVQSALSVPSRTATHRAFAAVRSASSL